MAIEIIQLKDIKKNASFLKVMGAYVQEPNPGVYGLSNDEILESVDASALYPTIEILFNIGFETLYGRVYDVGILDNLINLFQAINKNKSNPSVKTQALMAFDNALSAILKNYTSSHSVSNKSEYIKVNKDLAKKFFEKISDYIINSKDDNPLDNLFNPSTDQEYFLLRSNFLPLIELISWLSEKNKGYNEMIVTYAYEPETFYKKYQGKNIYVFENIHSTKLKFRIINFKTDIERENLDNFFQSYILNPYGTMFIKHKEKLSYNVKENKAGLKRRRIVKNAMLCIEGILDAWDRIDDNIKDIFLNKSKSLNKGETFKLTEQELYDIFTIVDKGKDPAWRIASLKDFEFESSFDDYRSLYAYLTLRAQQLNSTQLGIKVTLNSGYGIQGLITYQYSSPLTANSITNGGKIVGIKTFQQIAVNTINKHFKV